MGRKKKNSIPPDFKVTDILSIDDIYMIINYVQTQKKECCFNVCNDDNITINNILKDLGMTYETSTGKEYVKYTIHPPSKERHSEDVFIFEELPDELPDENDCFGV